MENDHINTTKSVVDKILDEKETSPRRVFIELLSPDNKKTTRLHLQPDPNMNAISQVAKFEPESPQSPGADSQMSFNVYDARLSGSGDTCLGALLPNSASTIGFLHDRLAKDGRMVPGYSRKIRQLSLCLLLFITVSLVMAGLFVWRAIYYDSGPKTEATTIHIKEDPKTDCPVRAKAVPLITLPNSIQDALTEIEQQLMKANAKDDTVSIMANVVYMDKVIWERSFGRMNKSNPTSPKLSSSTVFPIASVTKVLTALMLYKLYYEKKVKSLDDPFKKYMPRFSIHKDPFSSYEIVLRQMVTHMSGFPREAPCLSQKEQMLCPDNNTVMLERIKNLTLIAQPGDKVSYSNLGFALLGQGLAFSQNTSYEEWTQRNIFDPLKMHDSGFKLTPEIKQRIPVGYLKKDPQEPVEWGWANAAGGMFTSLVDIAKLEIKLFESMEKDDFLSPVMTEEFFSPAYILNGKQFMGSPWEMYLMNGYLARTKTGYMYGYGSNICLFPELKLAFNIFNTGSFNGRCTDLASKLLMSFHKELIARDKEQQQTISEQEAAPYLGEFYTKDVPTIRRVIITHQDEQLIFFVDKEKLLLNHLNGTTFELLDRRKVKCILIVVMGINHEKVHFDAPGNSTGWISSGFTVFGFHPRGKAYFYRKQL